MGMVMYSTNLGSSYCHSTYSILVCFKKYECLSTLTHLRGDTAVNLPAKISSRVGDAGMHSESSLQPFNQPHIFLTIFCLYRVTARWWGGYEKFNCLPKFLTSIVKGSHRWLLATWLLSLEKGKNLQKQLVVTAPACSFKFLKSIET